MQNKQRLALHTQPRIQHARSSNRCLRYSHEEHTLKGPSSFESARAVEKASERNTLLTEGLLYMCLYRLRMLLQDSKNLTSSMWSPPTAIS